MKEKKLPLVVYGLLVACLAFVLGYLLGQGNGTTQLSVTSESTTPAATVSAAAEDTPAASEEPEVTEESAASPEPEEPAPTAQSPLDLNTATQAQLEQLPGIGPELAGRILAYRQLNGSFAAKEQLMDVDGIGEKRYADIEPLVTIGGTP